MPDFRPAMAVDQLPPGRAAAVADSPSFRDMPGPVPSADALPPGGLKPEAVERNLVRKALSRAKRNKTQAAELLGLPRGQFYSLLRRHGLTDARRKLYRSRIDNETWRVRRRSGRRWDDRPCYSTMTRSVAPRPKVSGAYISSAFGGGTTNVPGVVARAT
jgi:hypothetical protein